MKFTNTDTQSEKSAGSALAVQTPAEIVWSEHPLADRAWRLYVDGHSLRSIGQQLGFSHVFAWKIIRERTDALKEVCSPAHKAACVGVLLERYGELYRRITARLEPAGDVQSIAALTACAIRINQAVAELHCIGKEMSDKTIVDHHRLEEVERRIKLCGPHSKAARAAGERAFKLAGITTEEVEGDRSAEVQPPAPQAPPDPNGRYSAFR